MYYLYNVYGDLLEVCESRDLESAKQYFHKMGVRVVVSRKKLSWVTRFLMTLKGK